MTHCHWYSVYDDRSTDVWSCVYRVKATPGCSKFLLFLKLAGMRWQNSKLDIYNITVLFLDSHQDASRNVAAYDLPSCLVLTLCRFSYNIKLNKNVKLRTPVRYPSTLVLKDKEYSLNAVIVHSGSSLNGGHYYTYARSLLHTQQW